MLQSSRLTECRSFDEDDTWQRKRVCAHLSLCFLNGILQPRQEHEERFSFILDSCQTTERRHDAEIGPTLNRETRARAWSKMMNFEFKCPQCGQMVEADEAYRGQVAECPHCGKGIVVPRRNPRTGTIRNHGIGKGETVKASHAINQDQKQGAANFCSKCGNKLSDGENFCSKCGAPRNTAGVTSPVPESSVAGMKNTVFSSFLKKKRTISGICTAIFIGAIIFFCIPDSRERLEKQASMTVMKMLTEHEEFGSYFTIEKTADCLLVNTGKNNYSGSVDVYCRWKDDTQKERMRQLFISTVNGGRGVNGAVVAEFVRLLGDTQKFKFDVEVVTDGSRSQVMCQGATKQENLAYAGILTMLGLRADE